MRRVEYKRMSARQTENWREDCSDLLYALELCCLNLKTWELKQISRIGPMGESCGTITRDGGWGCEYVQCNDRE